MCNGAGRPASGPSWQAFSPSLLLALAAVISRDRLTGTLATIEALVEDAHPQPPTLIIIGNVVEMAARLRWFGAG